MDAVVHRPRTPEELAAIADAPRAVVSLTVEWSVPERHARASFSKFVARLTADRPGLGVAFFVVDEDDSNLAVGLRQLGATTVGSGAGTVLWLERGRRVSIEISPGADAATALVERTLALWDREAPGATAP